jgi:hypothetical protein
MSGVKVGSTASSFWGLALSASGLGASSSEGGVGFGVAVASGVGETVLGSSAGGVEPPQAAPKKNNATDKVSLLDMSRGYHRLP